MYHNQNSMRPTKFQFQSGSIKTCKIWNVLECNWVFQFQSGSIKTGLFEEEQTQSAKFQFQSGSIKTWKHTLDICIHILRFNSNLVRLKHHCGSGQTSFVNGFNSNLVRLKQPTTDVVPAILTPFQFQSGSIKTH